jgi:hypothetical protein
MDWQHFESKLLASAAYDDDKRILYLRFRSGEVYRYFEFPAERYRELLAAESRGPLLPQLCSKSIPLRTAR